MSVKAISVPTKILSQSITAAATTFRLNDIKGWDGVNLTSASFGTQAYGVFRNAARTQIELFEFNPTTIASADITITRRGLKYDGDLTTEVSTNKYAWTKGDTYVDIGTDTPQIFENLLQNVAATATNVGAINAAAASKNPPIDADTFPITDTAAANIIKKVSFTNLKAFLKTYFDTLYANIAGSVSQVFSASTIELGHATDTTFAREAAGIGSIENEILNGYATTATAAGTTTLTRASAKNQVFTGATTQTVTLPTTGTILGQQYIISNKSTGKVTVQSSGANTVLVLGTGMVVTFTAQVATPTTAANWEYTLIDGINNDKDTTASANAATIDLMFVSNTISNNSAATLTVTLPTAGAVDGQRRIVRVLDFSAVAQTITWVNTETAVTPPTPSNGSTTLPKTAGFQFNGATSLWRCIASA